MITIIKAIQQKPCEVQAKLASRGSICLNSKTALLCEEIHDLIDYSLHCVVNLQSKNTDFRHKKMIKSAMLANLFTS